MRFAPTAADLTAAKTLLGQASPDADRCDYITQYPVPAQPPVQQAGAADQPPLRLIRMITDADPQAPLRIRNTRGINIPFQHGITLLHIACRLFSFHRAGMRERQAEFYDKVVTALVESGADPMAEMRTARGDIETPASICRGFMPHALRQRMLAEAGAGRIDTGGVPEAKSIDKRRQRQDRLKRTPFEQCLRDAGNAWEILSRRGRVIGAVAYTPSTRTLARQLAYKQRRRMVTA